MKKNRRRDILFSHSPFLLPLLPKIPETIPQPSKAKSTTSTKSPRLFSREMEKPKKRAKRSGKSRRSSTAGPRPHGRSSWRRTGIIPLSAKGTSRGTWRCARDSRRSCGRRRGPLRPRRGVAVVAAAENEERGKETVKKQKVTSFYLCIFATTMFIFFPQSSV